MSQRKSISHPTPAPPGTIGASADSNSALGIVVVALRVLCLVGEATATATYIAALSRGWLRLGALTAIRASNQPARCPVTVTRVRRHPLR
jgi:hypothetical protein